ncbi:hypothetical protein R103_H10016 [Saccharomyces cerevisiae R103]|uniref:EC1118_1H21_0034p n=1 Tax=Saccharomyces cerevisiae (strain Lalvin EC1118 / Prise de mousse) TaxID=643680 RepID=C8ZA18_YEAS8|nr:hypothetical protein R008_P10016 [Saccharomyces cerevisiae R008]EWG95718.1 hypothetical protein R103_H10016 [Saccharomyces cerevisiae R103]CAY80234.1 EC1118_1H21_0034p [Saccharomyces cerevisiae EC1118]
MNAENRNIAFNCQVSYFLAISSDLRIINDFVPFNLSFISSLGDESSSIFSSTISSLQFFSVFLRFVWLERLSSGTSIIFSLAQRVTTFFWSSSGKDTSKVLLPGSHVFIEKSKV